MGLGGTSSDELQRHIVGLQGPSGYQRYTTRAPLDDTDGIRIVITTRIAGHLGTMEPHRNEIKADSKWHRSE